MTSTTGLAKSVHVRLVAHSKEIGVEAQLILERFALYRLLYRLSKSRHCGRFVLKGAQLMLIWIGETVRPTRDADLLGFGDLSDKTLTQTFRDICTQEVEPDGMEYLPSFCNSDADPRGQSIRWLARYARCPTWNCEVAPAGGHWARRCSHTETRMGGASSAVELSNSLPSFLSPRNEYRRKA